MKEQPNATIRKKQPSRPLRAVKSRKVMSSSFATKARRAARVCGKCSTHSRHYRYGAQGCSPDGRPLLRSQRGACVGHISPEAMEGGPIALVKDGDRILVDVPNRRLELLVDEAELARRKAAWKRPEPKVKTGYLSRYARLVTSANTGAVMK